MRFSLLFFLCVPSFISLQIASCLTKESNSLDDSSPFDLEEIDTDEAVTNDIEDTSTGNQTFHATLQIKSLRDCSKSCFQFSFKVG